MVDAARVTSAITGSTVSSSRSATAPGASNTANGASTISLSGVGILGVAFSALFLV